MSSDDEDSSDSEDYARSGTPQQAFPKANRIQAVIFTGLQNVGRTTLLEHFVDTLPRQARPAVCVHRFARRLGIDDAPTVESQALGDHDALARYADVYDFGSGSSCCAANGDFARELRVLRESAGADPTLAPTHLLIETTGMADPRHFVRLLAKPEFAAAFVLRAVVCVVSVAEEDGAALTSSGPAHQRGMAQLGAADLVLVNKADHFADADALEEAVVMLRTGLRERCPSASVCLWGAPLKRTAEGKFVGYTWDDLDAELGEERKAREDPPKRPVSSQELAARFDMLLAAKQSPLPPPPRQRPAGSLGAPPAAAAPLPPGLKKQPQQPAAGGGPPPLPSQQKQVQKLELSSGTQQPRSGAGTPTTPTTPTATVVVAEESSSAGGGHDHDAEHEAAMAEWEHKLLPPPPEVVLWTSHKYEKHDDEVMRIQGVKAVKWLVQALLAAWCSDRLKNEGRRLLAVRAFTANLRFMHLWHETPSASMDELMQTVLMTPIKSELVTLGHILEDNYKADNLFDRIGHLKLPLHHLIETKGQGEARQGLCVPSPPAGWNGQPAHRCEFAYLHVLIMLSGAINAQFQDWCRETLGDNISELQTPPIKSYGRMRNKMFSADDHRFTPLPRPQKNVDINRVLAVCHSPESMIQAAQAVSDASGGVAKQKNGFGLAEHVAASQFHLRLVMLSMVFEMPSQAQDDVGRTMTYAELAALPSVKKMWDDYAKEPPKAGEAGCEWDSDVAAARTFLQSDDVASLPVHIIAEIQMVLPLTCEVRHKMHELYKVARADTDKQLYLDFKPIADKEERKVQSSYDDETPMRRAARKGDLQAVANSANLLMRADPGPALDRALDDVFIVACRHGQIEVACMDLMLGSRERVGWQAADEVIDKCARPSLEVLKMLFETPGWTWADTKALQDKHHHNHGHTLLHTACNKGHTDVVSLLIKYGCHVNTPRARDGCTGLFLACQFGHVAIVDVMLAAHADHSLHKTSDQASPLYTAAESGHLWVVDLLISSTYGPPADVFHESHDRPPNLIAANNTHRDVVLLLNDAMAKINLTKKQTETVAVAGSGAMVGGNSGKKVTIDAPDKVTNRSGAGRRAGMMRKKRQAEAERMSGHVMHALAQQLRETFTQSGMTPELLFNTFEKDGDGEIGRDEFRRMLQSLGANVPSATLDDLFTMLDKDGGGDGEIDLEEFTAWFQTELPNFAAGSQANLVDRVYVPVIQTSTNMATGRKRVISMAQTKESV